MDREEVKHILCSVHGQPESRKTVTRAIELALEHNAALTFCLMIDVEFLAQATPTLTPLSAAYRQIEEMGEFSLLILVDRAQRRGVKEVDILIRRGNIPEQLHRLVREMDSDILVLGRPIRRAGGDVLNGDEYDAYVKRVERKTGVKVIPVDYGG